MHYVKNGRATLRAKTRGLPEKFRGQLVSDFTVALIKQVACIASDGHLSGLGGYGGHKMNSEVKADLKIELSDLNYLCSQGRMIEIVNPHQIANRVRPYLQ